MSEAACNVYTVTLVSTNVYLPACCSICGGMIEEDGVLAVVDGGGYVCPDCLAVGPKGVGERLRRRADDFHRGGQAPRPW